MVDTSFSMQVASQAFEHTACCCDAFHGKLLQITTHFLIFFGLSERFFEEANKQPRNSQLRTTAWKILRVGTKKPCFASCQTT